MAFDPEIFADGSAIVIKNLLCLFAILLGGKIFSQNMLVELDIDPNIIMLLFRLGIRKDSRNAGIYWGTVWMGPYHSCHREFVHSEHFLSSLLYAPCKHSILQLELYPGLVPTQAEKKFSHPHISLY